MAIDYVMLKNQDTLAQQVRQHVVWPQDDQSSELLSDGFALPQDPHGLMVFEDVESHVDGFGWALLMLVQGQGEFQLVRNGVLHCIEMKEGDVLVFDNRDEHGFMPAVAGLHCAGVAIDLSVDISPDEVQALASLHELCDRHYAGPVAKSRLRTPRM